MTGINASKIIHTLQFVNNFASMFAPCLLSISPASAALASSGRALQSVGFASPDDVSIQAAIEANDAFIAQLEAIRDRAQTLTIE